MNDTFVCVQTFLECTIITTIVLVLAPVRAIAYMEGLFSFLCEFIGGGICLG